MKNNLKSDKHKKSKAVTYIAVGVCMSLAVFIIVMLYVAFSEESVAYVVVTEEVLEEEQPDIIVDLLTVNPYSRPGIKVDEINNIVIHYVGNPGTTAAENRDYFEGLKDTQTTQASSNFIIGLEGEIIQCIPTWEVAYASNERNIDSVSIEVCHEDESGEFSGVTYDSVVELTAWLCLKFQLTEEDVIRHYDITGKNCPKYYVENEESWVQFKKDVRELITE